jgi:hypothetical protein
MFSTPRKYSITKRASSWFPYSKRLAEASRQQLIERVERAHAEFLAGDFEELTAAEIVARATQ